MSFYRAEAAPSGRGDSSLAERGRKVVASIPCKCGRPSTIVVNRFSAGTTRRTCLCRGCADRAEARRARVAAMTATLGI